MSMLELRRVSKVYGQGTSTRRSSRYARAAHRQRADMEPCIFGDLEHLCGDGLDLGSVGL